LSDMVVEDKAHKRYDVAAWGKKKTTFTSTNVFNGL
jgi:hypothetical protein